MKRFVVALCILAAFATSSRAELNGWGINGAWWDTSDLNDEFGIGSKVDIEMISNVALDIRLSYFGGYSGDNSEDNLDIVPLEGGFNLYQRVGENVDAFGGGGIGYYFFDGQRTLDADDEVGFYVNLGLERLTKPDKNAVYGGGALGFFVEGIYRILDAETLGHDLSLDGIGINAGAMIRW